MKNIVIMYGGDVVEHDISIITAIQTYNNIDKNLYNVIAVYINKNEFFILKNPTNIEYYLHFNRDLHKKVYFQNGYLLFNKILKKKIKIDCILLTVHGGIYEGGSLQGYFDIVNIPYTSPNCLASNICMDKAISKVYFNSLGLQTVDYMLINKSQYNIDSNVFLEKILHKLHYPIIVKPNDQGSSIGINIASNYEELITNIDTAFCYSNNVIVEQALVDFTEYNCAAVNTKLDIFVSEIEKPTNFKDYLTFENKYMDNIKLETKTEFPAKISVELAEEIKNVTETIVKSLNIKGVTRCDFLYDNITEKLYINEINTIPGSLANYLFKNQFTFSELINLIIEDAIAEKQSNFTIKQYQTSVLSNFKNSIKTPFIK